MKIKYLKCDWGMEGYGSPKERLKKYKDAGYDGVECANIGMEAEKFADYIGHYESRFFIINGFQWFSHI